jgi:DNA-binding transcriptional LysR family regulator
LLDLYKLKIFALVVQEGSFSGAAERLLMSQSGVSQHIQDLERHFGTVLFQRGRRGVTLTAAGEQLLEYTQLILKLVAEAEYNLTRPENLAMGQLLIGATPGISVYLMPDWLQSFRARYPKLTVSLQTNITSQIVANVRGHRIELGFVEGELDDVTASQIRVLVLEEVEQYVVVGRKHPWWERTSVEVHELNGQPFIMRQQNSQTRRWLEQTLSQFGVHPRVVAEFDNLELIKRSVISSACLTVLPNYVLQQEIELGLVRLIGIVDAPLVRTLKMVLDKERPLSPVTHAFLKEMAIYFPQLLQI